LLRELFKLYLEDMAEWFDIDPAYDTTSIWARGYDVYLARVDDALAGFALLEWLDDSGTHDVHEFFVVREFRRRGVGQRMATQLWDLLPGKWLVRVLDANMVALNFWRNTISAYARDSHKEEHRDVNGRSWTHFRFLSPRFVPTHDLR
jgi:predicted acetyltransferase